MPCWPRAADLGAERFSKESRRTFAGPPRPGRAIHLRSHLPGPGLPHLPGRVPSYAVRQVLPSPDDPGSRVNGLVRNPPAGSWLRQQPRPRGDRRGAPPGGRGGGPPPRGGGGPPPPPRPRGDRRATHGVARWARPSASGRPSWPAGAGWFANRKAARDGSGLGGRSPPRTRRANFRESLPGPIEVGGFLSPRAGPLTLMNPCECSIGPPAHARMPRSGDRRTGLTHRYPRQPSEVPEPIPPPRHRVEAPVPTPRLRKWGLLRDGPARRLQRVQHSSGCR